jgi:hypothetical protein
LVVHLRRNLSAAGSLGETDEVSIV